MKSHEQAGTLHRAQPQPTHTDNEVIDFSYEGHKAKQKRAAIHEKHFIAR